MYFRYCIYSSGQLTLNDLKDVRGAIYEARPKWYDIGIELRLTIGTLDAIRDACPNDAGDCLTRMCIAWLKRINPPPSWAALASALESPPVGEGHLAQQLKNKYSRGSDETIILIPRESLPDGFSSLQSKIWLEDSICRLTLYVGRLYM